MQEFIQEAMKKQKCSKSESIQSKGYMYLKITKKNINR